MPPGSALPAWDHLLITSARELSPHDGSVLAAVV